MSKDLNERSRKILEAVVEDYIASAEPIGSKAVLKRHHMGVSPATVRNVMSELEEMGYLSSPHTSAGRIPTDKGYRFYVDTLLQVRPLSTDERTRIERYYTGQGMRGETILREAGKSLSRMSQYAGVVMAPQFNDTFFRRIDFLPLSPGRVLAIFVNRSGQVQNKIINADEDISGDDLARMTDYLNRVLQGLSVDQVREKIAAEARKDQARYDRMQQTALSLSAKALASDREEGTVYIEGASNILDQPEFTDITRMKSLIRALEQKHQLIDLLDRSRRVSGVQIFIGSETRYNEIAGCSLVTSTYATKEGGVGVLGVIGPSRMPYSHVIPIVDYTARIVGQLLDSE